jgi:hypothetical protein
MNQKIWSWFSFSHKKPVRPLAEKTKISVVKKAKEEYLSLAWKDLSPYRLKRIRKER